MIICLILFSSLASGSISVKKIIRSDMKLEAVSNNKEPLKSPWPMFSHDLRHTGRSPYNIYGDLPVVLWNYSIKGLIHSSPVIDEEGTIYIGGGSKDKFLFALNPMVPRNGDVELLMVFVLLQQLQRMEQFMQVIQVDFFIQLIQMEFFNGFAPVALDGYLPQQ
jgi:hypothetical protein